MEYFNRNGNTFHKGFITDLYDNQIFVFGSNTEGRHGAGAAKQALDKFGAVYGQAEGLQGQSYGFITTELRSNKERISLLDILVQRDKLYQFATRNPKWQFLVTEVGTGLAGLNFYNVAHSMLVTSVPSNVFLPLSFYEVIH